MRSKRRLELEGQFHGGGFQRELKLVSVFCLLVITAAWAGGGMGDWHSASAATTRTWIGAASNSYWSSPTNWSPTGAPVDGDAVGFNAATTDSNQYNDLGYFDLIHNRFVPLRLSSLTLNKGVLLVGNRLAVTSSIVVGASPIEPTLNLPVELAGNVQIFVANGSTLQMWSGGFATGTIAIDTVGHSLTKTGGGVLAVNEDLAGGGTFTTSGGTTLFRYEVSFGGNIAMGGGTSLKFAPGPLITASGPGPCGAPGAAVTLAGANLSTKCDTFLGSIAGAGAIDLSDPLARLTITVTGETFDGPISGGSAAKFNCCALGVQTLRGSSTFNGNVVVTGGSTLLLEGATFPASSAFTVRGQGSFQAELGGFGTFGTTVMTVARLSLESINGKFGFGRFPQLLLGPDVLVAYEIKSGTPGSGFTQLVTTDKVDIDGALLQLDFGNYIPSAGQSFSLIKGFTTGTFRNFADGKSLAEGAFFTTSGMQFKISYNGDAEDVVITRQGGTSTPTPSPTSPTQFKNKRILPGLARDN